MPSLGDTSEQARAAIVEVVPIPSSAESARQLLERNGFDCSWEEQQPWPGVATPMDYVYCTCSAANVVSRRWQVAVVHEDRTVVDVQVATGLVGP